MDTTLRTHARQLVDVLSLTGEDAVYLAGWSLLYLVLALLKPGLPRVVRQNKAHKLEWDMRIVSTIHAVVLAIGSCLVFLDARKYSDREMVFGYDVNALLFARIFRAYLTYDLVMCVAFYGLLKDWASIVHHLIFLSISIYAIGNNYFKFQFAWLSFAEVSTPFVNLRWQMAICGDKSSALYKLNAILLTLTFFLARVLLYGGGLLHMYLIRDAWYGPDTPMGIILSISGIVLGYVLNLYWFRLLVNGLIKLLRKPSVEKAE